MTIAADEFAEARPLNWVEHMELLEEAMNEVDKLHPHLPQCEMPKSITDTFCVVEAVVGQEWEEQP